MTALIYFGKDHYAEYITQALVVNPDSEVTSINNQSGGVHTNIHLCAAWRLWDPHRQLKEIHFLPVLVFIRERTGTRL